MPYILEKDRKKFLDIEVLFKTRHELNGLRAGELNYLVTKIIDRQLGMTPNYARFNEIIGVLECCKLELYRKIIAKYEDKKCNENGEVYEDRE